MKNVHILSTDKPSRLHLAYDKYYYLSVKPFTQLYTKNYKSFHIYITSDEEIKERDWYLTFLNKEVIGKPRKCEDSNWNFSGCKKIILTTDTDLIKDGVQAIDDEFLEWFVKNPSCEWVEAKLIEEIPSGFTFGMFGNDEPPTELVYKIIIPKEELTISDEAKQRAKNYMSLKGALEPKQETLEEAAQRLYPIELEDDEWDKNKQYRDEWIEGAKWQAERMYSEEEVKEILMKTDRFLRADLDLWFEQFKKK